MIMNLGSTGRGPELTVNHRFTNCLQPPERKTLVFTDLGRLQDATKKDKSVSAFVLCVIA